MASSISVSSSPRNIEIIAGGASKPPSLWSLPADATEILSRSWYSSTALMTTTRKRRNWALSWGLSPGSSRLMPVSETRDQLLCFPEPLRPAKGFSCRRQAKPCFSAIFFISSIVSWFWSTATFVVV